MFTDSDFLVFTDPTLSGRMEKIRATIDPKFEKMAVPMLRVLEAATGEAWFDHVAKHRMRTTNAPDTTWVAFSTNKRGYKMLPHFELGFWHDNLYLYLAVESNMKPKQTDVIYPKLKALGKLVEQLPSYFVLSQNHMVNQTLPLSEYSQVVEQFKKVKALDVLIGIKIERGDKRFGTSALDDDLEQTLKTLLPLYEKLV
ncbi:hypothetical protein BGL34_04180 [Fructilactobacillus lindneri]|uniref:Uncharacterized protein n=2 Tax=Fructilactobacillus lindneri TaxID=53444 RepID=A0A0R2JRC3_9LACO|nr:DUF1054 family protein [Fructilactobacillus lindneri]ANZ57686.1 hypothetical protein AYR60_02360 [Fructilactobacillus lindneri]ANZ58956.1 hypothetical protein AYR59_02360 [Fructilactobacillus lindneri]KRN78422.1 hypothetical protein IV52_GL001192 [Fructilactobacillus lindneri DSM 20690 = JCM 11027]POG97981.1 hypothetical protein BGL31_04575 [Fructilactobacillus lindneri]POG99035.1 hypothetical protein BGL32_06290 [Fructilactobacillus lindneri]